MKFWEAMKLVSEGNEVRRSKWGTDVYVKLARIDITDGDDVTVPSCYNAGMFTGWYNPIVWDLTASDWEVA